MTDPDAHRIVNALIGRITTALMTGDLAMMAGLFRLPLALTTASRATTVRSAEDFRKVFDETCAGFGRAGVTRLVRECEVAEFKAPDRIEATQINHVFVGKNYLLPAFPVFSVLELSDGDWKITSSDFALEDDNILAAPFLQVPCDPDRAQKISQDHLDTLSKALLSGDFASFHSRIGLPHHLSTETDTRLTSTSEQLKQSFDNFTTLHRDTGMTEFVRVVQSADFVSDTVITGTHISHQMRHGKRLVPPYPNRIRLKRGDDGIWRETHCANAVINRSDNFKYWTRVAASPRLPDLDLSSERTPND